MRWAFVAVLPLVVGCYRYVPLEVSQLEPGANVRLRISAAEAERVEPLLGRTDARLLTGRMIASGADIFLVEVATTTQMSPGQALHQRISIPRSGLLEAESRALDPTRTAIVSGVVTAAVVAILIKSRVIGPGKSGGPGGGSPPEFRPY